jgi:hypothetical protein
MARSPRDAGGQRERPARVVVGPLACVVLVAIAGCDRANAGPADAAADLSDCLPRADVVGSVSATSAACGSLDITIPAAEARVCGDESESLSGGKVHLQGVRDSVWQLTLRQLDPAPTGASFCVGVFAYGSCDVCPTRVCASGGDTILLELDAVADDELLVFIDEGRYAAGLCVDAR